MAKSGRSGSSGKRSSGPGGAGAKPSSRGTVPRGGQGYAVGTDKATARAGGSDRRSGPDRRVLGAVVGLVLIVAAALLIYLLTRGDGAPSTAANLPQLQTGEPSGGVWPPEHSAETTRMKLLGLSLLSAEGEVLHTHQHLDLIVDGKPLTVPQYIGIDPKGKYISPLHTHDTRGVIHVESPKVKTFTLGQFFGVWGVRLTTTCMGGYCTGGGKKLVAFVNGKAAPDPTAVKLAAHQEIVLAYGPEATVGKKLPSSYKFQSGE